MELLKIDNNNLKITLTSEDFSRYDLDMDQMDQSDLHTKRLIRTVLDKARECVGFDARPERITVAVYGSPDGGCEMYITKNTDHALLPDNLRTFDPCLCLFDDLEPMLRACLALRTAGYSGDSQALYTDEGYYLHLSGTGRRLPSARSHISGSDIIGEFGILLEPSLYTYLSEHTTLLCPERAVETLSALCAK